MIPTNVTNAVVKCLQILTSNDPDGAREENGIGFNRYDSARGRQLADFTILQGSDVVEAADLLRKYHRQLPVEDVEIINSWWLRKEVTGELPEKKYREESDYKVTECYCHLGHPPCGFCTSQRDDSDSELEEDEDGAPLPPTPPAVQLSEEQELAVNQIFAFLTDPDPLRLEFKLGGFAGTGKTTIIKELIRRLDDLRYTKITTVNVPAILLRMVPMVCAFTGKACNVLRRKGVRANTIHSLIYRLVSIDPKSNQMEWRRVSKTDLFGTFFIVDEASMISTDIYKDLRAYGIKMLFVGDPGQLEPVGENPLLMTRPDLVLKHIHRQALDNPIIKLSKDIREGHPIPPIGTDLGVNQQIMVRDKNLKTSQLADVDQIICGKNATRQRINRTMRLAQRRVDVIDIGEKLIVLKNNRDAGVFNGLIIYVDRIVEKSTRYWVIDCHDDADETYRFPVWLEPFTMEEKEVKNTKPPKGAIHCDYGYCITCHKSQGSEWDHVLVVFEWMPAHIWDNKKWLYTAVTRAAQRLTLCRE